MSEDIIYSVKANSSSEQMYHRILDILWTSNKSTDAHYSVGRGGIFPLISGTYLIKFMATGYKEVEDENLSLGAHVGMYLNSSILPPEQSYKIDATQTNYMKNKSSSFNVSCVNTVVVKFRYTPFEPNVHRMFKLGLSHYHTGEYGTEPIYKNIHYSIIRISDSY